MENNNTIAEQSLINEFFQQFPKEAALTIGFIPNEKILAYLQRLAFR